MTNRQVVSRLRELGHEVGVYVRKDGSLRITSIDGIKYSHRLSEGVQAGRDILSAADYSPIGEESRRAAQAAQRAAARQSRARGDTLSRQDPTFQKEFRKFQREVRKINKRLAKEGKRPSFGVDWKSTRESARRAGISPEQQLRRARDYFRSTSQGIAPRQMVEELRNKIELYSPMFHELEIFLPIIDANFDRLDIYEVRKTLDWLYGYVKTIPQSETPEQRAQRLLATVHREK